MSHFTVHTPESAPIESRPLLEKSRAAFGMVPNLHAAMAESPQLLEAYQHLHQLFQTTSLTPEEQTVVWQSINREHNCHYCLPAHTAVARMMKIDPDLIESLNQGSPLTDSKLEALRTLTLQLVRQRGALQTQQTTAFFEAGYSKRQLLEVLLGVTQKTMSNYFNHLANTPIDEPFKKFVNGTSSASPAVRRS